MDIAEATIVAATIIAVSILLSNGIYEFSSDRSNSVHRYNVYTGNLEFCVLNSSCRPFEGNSAGAE